MKRILSTFIILVLSVSLISCGSAVDSEEIVSQAKETVDYLNDSLKKRDFETASNYIDVDKLKNEIDKKDSTYSRYYDFDLFIDKWFSSINIDVLSDEYIDKNTVKLKAEVTTYSMDSVVREYLQALINILIDMKNMLNGVQSESKSMYDIIDETLNNISTTTTTEVDITVSNVNGNWQVEVTDEFVNAILGDVDKAENNLTFALNQVGITSIEDEIDDLMKKLDEYSRGVY